MKNRIFLSPPHMGGDEIKYVQKAFESNYIAPLGPQVDAFEREFSEYTGLQYCVALASGTAAMHLGLRYLGIGPGDEVLCSTLTFIGSVTPVTFLGGTPVFIDCDRETWNMDPVLLEAELERCAKAGNLPKAVVPTDLYGQCCDYARIYEVCERFGVPVVMDVAEAMGARYLRTDERESERAGESESVKADEEGLKLGRSEVGKSGTGRWLHAGKGARAAVFSFNGNKIMTTSGGGMLASDDGELIEKARFWSQQAREPFVHYEHTEIGYNYRMSNILAAIGRGQLAVLDERVRRKREIFDYYHAALGCGDIPGIEFMPEASYGRCNRWLTVVLITPEMFGVDCEAVRQALEAENIESRPVWKPMHLQPVFELATERHRKTQTDKRKYTARCVGGKVAEDLFERGLCLPSGTAMTNSDLDRVIDIVLKCRRA
ncbi:MAG: DegT/DnrJ/EryC1/StrS family aminotransferase [Deltaproteobacteria bacterium]|nr:DegT/DnrJ/EryC1/StrS family aminotransferase [Deltaproteobacteria bacterium]